MGLKLSNRVSIPLDEIDFQAIRAQGAGGQNVNKVSTAIHLRFDINRSSLPVSWKERLMGARDRRISSDGTIVIKAQKFRSQEKNKADALERLRHLLQTANMRQKKRIPTKPTRGSRERRLDNKSRRSKLKAQRGKVTE